MLIDIRKHEFVTSKFLQEQKFSLNGDEGHLVVQKQTHAYPVILKVALMHGYWRRLSCLQKYVITGRILFEANLTMSWKNNLGVQVTSTKCVIQAPLGMFPTLWHGAFYPHYRNMTQRETHPSSTWRKTSRYNYQWKFI